MPTGTAERFIFFCCRVVVAEPTCSDTLVVLEFKVIDAITGIIGNRQESTFDLPHRLTIQRFS